MNIAFFAQTRKKRWSFYVKRNPYHLSQNEHISEHFVTPGTRYLVDVESARNHLMFANATNRDLETVAPSPGTIRPILFSNLERQAAPMEHWSKRLCALLVLPSFLAFSAPVKAQQPSRTLLLDAIATTSDIHRTETLVYLRVYSDGSAEAHPTHEVDFRALALKQAQIPE
jgi:hypothetical protein